MIYFKMPKKEPMKGYCIAFKNPGGIPGIYTMFGRAIYEETLTNAQRAGEEIIGVFEGEKNLAIKVDSEARKLVGKNPPSLEADLKNLGFKSPPPFVK